jgi:2-polyprenyl-3-methyl-5-hydroxy-6-metoxy-1,4-benzoquinol methylase
VSACCAPRYRKVFSKRLARRDARRYRRKGLDRTAQLIVDGLAERGVSDATVLEVGGGVGAIDIELLKAGARDATIVELSEEYDGEAARLLAENGLEDRVSRRHGDFVEVERELDRADVVVMHRVVCCYPDPESLVGAAAQHARRLLALSFPRDNWWVRAGWYAVDAWFRLVYRFASFVHPRERILGAAEGLGFTPVHEHSGRLWDVAVLERS